MSKVHVAVGLVFNSTKQVLIAKRPDTVHQGGLWEFPGGKVETNETVKQALARELLEELGIRIQSADAVMQISHQYNDKHVLLDVWSVDDFDGEPSGVEGQPVKWISLSELSQYQFPKANAEIVSWLQNR